MTDPAATADADADPIEDTPPGDTEDTAQDTPKPEQPTDWEARYKEVQKAYGRSQAELSARRAADAAAEADDEDEDEADDAEATPPAKRDRSTRDPALEVFERDSWGLATERYGQEAIDAFSSVHRVLYGAQTPADIIAALEAYHDIRSGGGSKEDATAAAEASTSKPSRKKAVEPQVDLNRSDASPDLNDLEGQFAEAKAEGNLDKFIRAATTAAGFQKRQGNQSKS